LKRTIGRDAPMISSTWDYQNKSSFISSVSVTMRHKKLFFLFLASKEVAIDKQFKMAFSDDSCDSHILS